MAETVIPMPTYYAMTLGTFIARLSRMDHGASIVVDTGDKVAGFASYRGFYDEIAMVPVASHDSHTPDALRALSLVGEVLAEAKACVGATFPGWKGGEYRMHESTDLWFAPEGHATGWRPVGFDGLGTGIVRVITCGGL